MVIHPFQLKKKLSHYVESFLILFYIPPSHQYLHFFN